MSLLQNSLPVFIALRYLRAPKGSGFVSFVSVASVVGVALGVAALIVVLSVMNGFEQELRSRLLGMTAHAALVDADGIRDWAPLVRDMSAGPHIVAAAPYIEFEAMLSGPAGLAGSIVTGVEPNLEQGVSRVADSMLLGNLPELRSGAGNIVLGRVLAQRLGVAVGDTLTMLVPRAVAGGANVDSRLKVFRVSGIFELGVQDHDSVRALVHLDDAADSSDLGEAISGIRIETDDIFGAPVNVRKQLEVIEHPPGLTVVDWTQQNASYFRAVKLEKIMMALLLSLIIGIAAFNIVASLVMVVTEKRGGIAILRTLGCSRRDVIKIFVVQGTLIGWVGAFVGIGAGVAMALNIDTLAPALESLLGFQFMPADLYYLTSLPTELRLGDVLWTAVIVLAVTALATIYPALRAASVQPAEVLRYE